MRRFLATITAVLAIGCAHADSGVYLGAGITHGRADFVYGTYDLGCGGKGCYTWRLNSTSWKLFAGWRPIRLFAAEVDFDDFGTSSVALSHGDIHLSAPSLAAYAVGFLPLPVRVVDIYGKVGFAVSELDGDGYTIGNRSNNATKFAWGAGVQGHLGRLGARLEYERFDVPQTSAAYILSISATCDL